jgi:hypothetical protein
MRLPAGIKHAVQMGANEVLLEWVDCAADDPEGALESLGASYQEAVTPDMFSEDEVRALIADLAAWDDGSLDGSHRSRVRRFETLMCNAGIDFARGLIAQATGMCEVPPSVAPYMGELTALVDVVKQAVEAGTFDDIDFDIEAAIWR